MSADRIVDQPPPMANEAPSVQALVRADLDERERLGRQRYGTPLQPVNGRDALVDAYQEVLDLACYLRQELAERDDPTLAVQLAQARMDVQMRDGVIAEMRRQYEGLERRLTKRAR
jgi:hypothetical protein